MLLTKFTILLALTAIQSTSQELNHVDQLGKAKSSINTLLSKADQTLARNADSSFILANEAVTQSKLLDDTLLLIKSYRAQGKAKSYLNQYNEAIQLLDIAVKLCTNTHNSSLSWELNNDIGEVYSSKGDYVNALKSYVEGLRIAERDKEKENIAKSNSSIAIILKNQKDYREAIDYLEKSLAIWRELNNSQNITRTIINIAGNLALLGDYNKSLENLLQAEKYASEFKDTSLLSDITISIANIYSYKSDFKDSEKYYLKGVSLKQSLNDKRGLAIIYNNMCVFYLNNSNYTKGERYAKLALENAKLSKLQNIQMASFKSLSYIYSKQKKFEDAYINQSNYIRLKDSLFTIQKSEQLAEIKTKYEAEKKEQQIKILESENQLKEVVIKQNRFVRNTLITGIIIFVILFMLIFRAYREKKRVNTLLEDKNRLIEQQKLDLSSKNIELNNVNSTKDRLFSIIAHDLRSPMSSMEGLSGIIRQLLSSGKTEKLDAVALHIDKIVNRLNSLLDNLLNWSLSQINGLHVNPEIVYIRNVVLYSADVQKSALEAKKITLNIDINDDLKVFADQNMLRTVIRNLISNAIKFTPSGGFINISAFPDNGFVRVSVKDSGIGIPFEKLNTIFEINSTKISAGTDGEKGTGLGLTLCRDFIALNNGDIGIMSENGKGTEVFFSLPSIQ
ncbi:MAG: tetratricopeptide repeat-containing sensor histidine kinase [Bacteroidales bacterium]|nr:tetratricopeptide repeat-containing sensor histidine kinase [Bacteroidales bacterium]